jgi:formylglycine-generating enzyme required for sulfatase activity
MTIKLEQLISRCLAEPRVAAAVLGLALLSFAPRSAEVGSPGMVRLAGGSFERGREGGRADESPRHRVRVRAFEIDATLVTRSAFAGFVSETGYVTTAERLGFGMAAHEGMDDWEWERVPHASWREPFAPGMPEREAFLADDAPVVMVSFEDASAYCAHYQKRLPTEAEWEYAMRGGSEGTRYPWGDDARRGGHLSLNFWQGSSHHRNTRDDGFVYVSPVRAFAPNDWGIFDPVGNVWQWTADYYAKDTYARVAHEGTAIDPIGAKSRE